MEIPEVSPSFSEYTSKSLHKYLYVDNDETYYFIENELLQVLLQVYIPLAMLGDKFTHYDLHLDNIQLVKNQTAVPIKYEYHYPEGSESIKFTSNYIVKIIDYGRSYFYENEDNSTSIYHFLKDKFKGTNIDEKFSEYGLAWLGHSEPIKTFRSCSAPNTSYDLFALYKAMQLVNGNSSIMSNELLNEIFNNIIEKLPYFHDVADVSDDVADVSDDVADDSDDEYDTILYKSLNEENNKSQPVMEHGIYTIYDCVKELIKLLPETPDPTDEQQQQQLPTLVSRL